MAYRVIFCLYVWLVGPQPGLGPALMLWLQPDGQLHKNGKNNNGKSRTGKRAIELRVGDEIMCGGKWMHIERIITYRDNWIDDEAYANGPRNDGFYYYLKGETRTAQELREANRYADISPSSPHDQPQQHGNQRRGD
jgi:hypothetical protein